MIWAVGHRAPTTREKKKKIKQLRSLLPQNKKFKARYFKDNIISTGTQAPCLSQYFQMTSFCYHSNMAAPVLMHQHPNTPLSKKKKQRRKTHATALYPFLEIKQAFPSKPPSELFFVSNQLQLHHTFMLTPITGKRNRIITADLDQKTSTIPGPWNWRRATGNNSHSIHRVSSARP